MQCNEDAKIVTVPTNKPNPPEIPQKDLKKLIESTYYPLDMYSKESREMIYEENKLTSGRIGWFFVSQGLLFANFLIALEKTGDAAKLAENIRGVTKMVAITIPFIGMLLSLCLWYGLRRTKMTIGRITNSFEKFLGNNSLLEYKEALPLIFPCRFRITKEEWKVAKLAAKTARLAAKAAAKAASGSDKQKKIDKTDNMGTITVDKFQTKKDERKKAKLMGFQESHVKEYRFRRFGFLEEKKMLPYIFGGAWLIIGGYALAML